MNKQKEKNRNKRRRHLRVRKTVFGTPVRPRMSVFRSHKNIYCQIIDDTEGKTLLAINTLTKGLRDSLADGGGNIKAAQELGKAIAKAAVEKGVKKICFDKGACKYHGRIKALAEAARKNGLEF